MWPCVRHLYIFIFLLHIYKSNGCSNIDQLLHSLPYLSSPDAKCTVGTDCSSVQCTNTQNTQYSVGLAVISCDNNPVIEVNVDIPSSGIISWRSIFNDQTEKAIPGYFFPDSSKQNFKRQGYLKVTLQKLPSSNSVILSMSLKGCENSSKDEKTDSLCTQKQIINNQQLVCGTERSLDKKKCSIYRPFECAERKETCLQIGQSNEGECVCLEGLTRDSNNICSVKEPSVSPTASTLADNTTTPTVPDLTEKDSAALAVNIVVPILMFILVAALLYAAFKHGLIHQLIVRWSGRRFERMNVRAEDDEDLTLA